MDFDLRAYAKINLGLDVLRKRDDGYHEVRMIMQTVDLYDVLSFSDTEEDEIRLSCSLDSLPVNEDNIAYRACRLIKDEYGIKKGVKLHIDKHIPVAAGMAGGSTDAATALIGMNRLFDLHISDEGLMEYGVRLGADVPYCIMRGTALSEGIGEILTRLSPMPECYLLIAKPPISVSTGMVYQNLRVNSLTYHPDIDMMMDALKNQDIKGISDTMGNVLETVTIPRYPVISQIKEEMLRGGALNSLMSGSGPTVFGIFEDEATAQLTANRINEQKLVNQIFVVKPFNIEVKENIQSCI